MVNPSKRKGTAFETELCRYLQREMEMPGIERRALSGTQDRGDIAGIPRWTIEAKNQNTSQWAAWMDELDVEVRNADTEFGLLVVRRKMKNIEKAYAVMPLGQAVDIMLDLEAK